MEREVKALQALNHTSILKMITFFKDFIYYDDKNDLNKITAIILEYCENQSILEYIQYNTCFEEKISWKLFIDIAKGLKHMHDSNISHRDLKLSNLLFNKEFEIKIADFGNFKY